MGRRPFIQFFNHSMIQSPQSSPEQTAAAITEFLQTHTAAAILEHGTVLFDMRSAQWSLNTDHNRCTLHLWSEERNLTRRVLSAEARSTGLRLSVQRFGQPKPSTLDLVSKAGAASAYDS